MALPVLRRNRAENGRDAIQHPATQHPATQHPATRPVPDRWSPWAEFAELHERMGRLLAQFDTALAATLDRPGAWRPAADVEETDDAYHVELELPGVRHEDVSVEFGGGELSVTGEIKQKERVGLLRTRTRPVGRFDYRIQLPAEVQDDQISAALSEGVLTVRVPKTESARRRRIAINSG
jgi:HSP20 family protein